MDLQPIYQHILSRFLSFANRKYHLVCYLMAEQSLSISFKIKSSSNFEVYSLGLVISSKYRLLDPIWEDHQQSKLVDHFI